jgi:SAM-dependent methyltransferase
MYKEILKAVLPRRVVSSLSGLRYRAHQVSSERKRNSAVNCRSKLFERSCYYRPDILERGFLDRRDKAVHAPDSVYDRVIASYNKAKSLQPGAGPCFSPSNEWLPIYESFMGEVMRVMKAENRTRLREIYSNFWRDPCSTGLHGLPLDMHKYYFNGPISDIAKKLVLIDGVHRHELWRGLVGKSRPIAELAAPEIGNPYGMYFDDNLINCGFYLPYYAQLIGRLTRSRSRRTVLEIGGGYGGLAYFLLRTQSNLTYVDFDLPENMALAAFYLLSAFPEKKILLFGEAELGPEALGIYDAIIQPSFEVGKIPDRSIDLAFNSYSLAEMSPDTIHLFISEFMRVVKTYILHVNHNKVSQVVADDFGIDPEEFDLLYKVPALWTMGLNPDADECEYLYKRITD